MAPTARSTSRATSAIRAAETNPASHVIVGRFNADGTPDTAFSEDGFAEVDLPGGTIEQSLAVAPLANGDVVAAINANRGRRRHLGLSRAL